MKLTTLLIVAALTQEPEAGPQEPAIPGPMPIPRTAILHRGEREITIDGSLQDWPALPPLILDDVRQISGTALGAWRGRGDLAARVFLLWDEEALYLAANVLDDWHVHLTEDSPRLWEIPPADSLTLTIDPGRNTRSLGNDMGRMDDAEFWLAEVHGQGRRVVVWDRFRGSARYGEGVEAVVRHDADERVTFHEARIPWAEILPHGEAVETGRTFDLQIVVDDFDEPTDPLPQTRVGWTFGMGPRIDPGLFGSAILVDASSEDLGGAAVPMPGIPPPERIEEAPVPGSEYWVSLWDRLREHGPVPADEETPDPRFAGGSERARALADLDRHCAEFPRVDFLEFQYRIHRRMVRESAGIAARGLPSFWELVLDRAVREFASAAPPEEGYRLMRLPQGGWLVRSEEATFAIDPSGHTIDRRLAEPLDFVLLTAPTDPTRRNDQLLIRMRSATPKKPVLTHLAIHLPSLEVSDLPLVQPGLTYEPSGLKVDVLGELGDSGTVSASVGFRVRWPDGSDLLVSGTMLGESMVESSDRPQCLLLSTVHPRARIVAQRLSPELVILDDVLQCARFAGAGGRASLEAAYELQSGLRPLTSLLLGPGETWPGPASGD